MIRSRIMGQFDEEEFSRGEGFFLPDVPQSQAVVAGLEAFTGAFPGVDFVTPILGAHVFSGYGRPRPGRNGVHEGIDIEARVGTPIFAIESGTITRPLQGDFAGTFVRITHNNGWTSRYMHLSKVVAPPGPVFRGQLIGHTGISGTSGTGLAHLHFDLHLDKSLLPAYEARFGRPRTGFGTCRSFGCAVPSEPMIPVATYSDRTIEDALKNGIPLFRVKRRRVFATLAVGGAVALAVAMASR